MKTLIKLILTAIIMLFSFNAKGEDRSFTYRHSLFNSMHVFQEEETIGLDKDVMELAYIVTVSKAAKYFKVDHLALHQKILNYKLKVFILKPRFSNKNKCPKSGDIEGRCWGFKCEPIAPWCRGFYNNKIKTILLADNPCIATNSFVHELLHVILTITKPEDKSHHDDQDIYLQTCEAPNKKDQTSIECAQNSLVYQIQKELLLLCI